MRIDVKKHVAESHNKIIIGHLEAGRKCGRIHKVPYQRVDATHATASLAAVLGLSTSDSGPSRHLGTSLAATSVVAPDPSTNGSGPSHHVSTSPVAAREAVPDFSTNGNSELPLEGSRTALHAGLGLDLNCVDC
eukprot:1185795-Prorocentrum_minimum.AAC.2